MSLYGDWQESGMTDAQFRDSMKWEMSVPEDSPCLDCDEDYCDACQYYCEKWFY